MLSLKNLHCKSPEHNFIYKEGPEPQGNLSILGHFRMSHNFNKTRAWWEDDCRFRHGYLSVGLVNKGKMHINLGQRISFLFLSETGASYRNTAAEDLRVCESFAAAAQWPLYNLLSAFVKDQWAAASLSLHFKQHNPRQVFPDSKELQLALSQLPPPHSPSHASRHPHHVKQQQLWLHYMDCICFLPPSLWHLLWCCLAAQVIPGVVFGLQCLQWEEMTEQKEVSCRLKLNSQVPLLLYWCFPESRKMRLNSRWGVQESTDTSTSSLSCSWEKVQGWKQEKEAANFSLAYTQVWSDIRNTHTARDRCTSKSLIGCLFIQIRITLQCPQSIWDSTLIENNLVRELFSPDMCGWQAGVPGPRIAPLKLNKESISLMISAKHRPPKPPYLAAFQNLCSLTAMIHIYTILPQNKGGFWSISRHMKLFFKQ